MAIEAKVIADSITVDGHRLTTIEAKIHRFVLSELNTHRALSRNSASSRARPVKKVIEEVENDPAWPVEFGTNQKGMQAGEPLTKDSSDYVEALLAWDLARFSAIEAAERLVDLNVHKQVVNRLLEPFLWHTVILTATEWDNFFTQRCHPDAQPEIRLAAEAIRNAREESTPCLIERSKWHTPYIQADEFTLDIEDLKKISVARCARVSYLNQGGVRSITDDFKLYDRLRNADPPHWSPFEHVATPWRQGLSLQGNFTGWAQLRHNT